MAHNSITAADIKALAAGGLLAEDVLRRVYDISPHDTPYLDAIQGGTYTNPYHSWIQDSLASPGAPNAQIDGADITAASTASGSRVGNHGQITTKTVNISMTTEHSDVIGRTSEEAYQTAKRLHELRNDMEYGALSNNASVADNGDSVAGETAGLGAWLTTHTSHGANGAAGGFQTDDSLVDTITAGDEGRALTFAMISTEIESCYLVGAKPTKIFTVPQITKRLGQYLIGSGLFVSPVANIAGGTPSDVAMSGYVDTFRTDFGYTMTIHPCRNQPTYAADDSAQVAALFGVDPEHVALRTMWGTKVEALSKTGLSTKKLISTHWSHDVLLEKAHFGIYDLTPTGTVAAS